MFFLPKQGIEILNAIKIIIDIISKIPKSFRPQKEAYINEKIPEIYDCVSVIHTNYVSRMSSVVVDLVNRKKSIKQTVDILFVDQNEYKALRLKLNAELQVLFRKKWNDDATHFLNCLDNYFKVGIDVSSDESIEREKVPGSKSLSLSICDILNPDELSPYLLNTVMLKYIYDVFPINTAYTVSLEYLKKIVYAETGKENDVDNFYSRISTQYVKDLFHSVYFIQNSQRQFENAYSLSAVAKIYNMTEDELILNAANVVKRKIVSDLKSKEQQIKTVEIYFNSLISDLNNKFLTLSLAAEKFKTRHY